MLTELTVTTGTRTELVDITARVQEVVRQSLVGSGVCHLGDYSHAEGNSPAHIKATLTGSSATLLVDRSNLVLGTWQGIFLAEFDGPRQRRVLVKVVSG